MTAYGGPYDKLLRDINLDRVVGICEDCDWRSSLVLSSSVATIADESAAHRELHSGHSIGLHTAMVDYIVVPGVPEADPPDEKQRDSQ